MVAAEGRSVDGSFWKPLLPLARHTDGPCLPTDLPTSGTTQMLPGGHKALTYLVTSASPTSQGMVAVEGTGRVLEERREGSHCGWRGRKTQQTMFQSHPQVRARTRQTCDMAPRCPLGPNCWSVAGNGTLATSLLGQGPQQPLPRHPASSDQGSGHKACLTPCPAPDNSQEPPRPEPLWGHHAGGLHGDGSTTGPAPLPPASSLVTLQPPASPGRPACEGSVLCLLPHTVPLTSGHLPLGRRSQTCRATAARAHLTPNGKTQWS